MLKNRLRTLSLLLVFAIASCTNISTSTPIVLPSPTSVPTNVVSVSASPTQNQSILPTAIPTPIVTATPLPIIITPTPTATPIVEEKTKILNIGINEPYIRVTNEEDKNRNLILNELTTLSPNFVIVDFNQDLIDTNMDGEVKESWSFYDNIIDELQKKGINVIFKIPFTNSLQLLTQPDFSNYLTFMYNVSKHYKEKNYKNLSWIVGDKINDLGSSKDVQKNYMTFLSQTSIAIKGQMPDSKIYAGSLIQGEISGSDYKKTMEEFLSYINMGITKYTDGFVFEVYSFANKVDSVIMSSPFSYTDYQLIGNYYNGIKEILDLKKIKDKEIILSTGTFGGQTVETLNQTEDIQANDFIKRFVYAVSLGFDKIFIPKLVDNDFKSSLNLIDSSGLIKLYSNLDEKKAAFYNFELITNKLKTAVYKGKIPNLPNYKDGYIFETDKNIYYIVWNNDNAPKDDDFYVKIELKSSKCKLYLNRTETSFDLGKSNIFAINFRTDPLVPRIIEIEK